jgi:hypothetical protein
MLRWLKAVVVSDGEKAPLRCQVGIGKASVSEPLLTCRNIVDDIETGETVSSRDELGGCPCSWPGGVRHVGGVSLVCGCCTERGKACHDTAAPVVGGERERPEGWKPEGLSTVAWRAGGPARSSGEAPVMGVERRGRLIDELLTRATGAWWVLGGDGWAGQV